MDVKYRNLISNTKIFAIGNIVTKLSQYIIVAICTHHLSTAEFGISDTIVQTVAMLVPIFSADIAEGLFRFSMDKNYSREQIITNSWIINVAGCIIAFLALPVEFVILKDIQTAIFITILILFEMFQLSIKEYVRGLGLTKTYLISGLLNAITQIIACYIFIYFLNFGIVGYILTLATAYLVEIIVCFIKVHFFRNLKIASVSKKVLTDLLKYSVPLAPNKIMWWVISASDRYFTLWILGPSETGLYSVAAKFPALITIFVGFFFQAWQISALQTSESDERDHFYSKIFNLLWAIMGMMTALAIVFIRIIVRILVADEYFLSWQYAPFLLVAAAFSAIQSFLGVNYTITKDSMGALKSTFVAAISNIVLNFILISTIGIQGATIATLVSFIIVTIYRFVDTRRYIHITVDNIIGFIITYSILITECIVLAIIPSLHWISIAGFIIVIIANFTACKEGYHFVGKQLKKSKNA